MGDTGYIIIKKIHDFCHDKSYKEAAKKLEISPQYLCDILMGRREISNNIARKFGYERKIIYRKIKVAEKDPPIN